MFIRYHLIYYAIAFILINLTRFYHLLFIIPFLIFLIFMIYRLSLKHIFICLSICLLVFIPRNNEINDVVIKGKVIKSDEKSCLVLTENKIIYLYHEYDLKYGDKIEAVVQFYDIKENTNDNLFNEKQYLSGLNVFNKGNIVELIKCENGHNVYTLFSQLLSKNKDLCDYQRLFLFSEKSNEIKDDYDILSDLSLVHLFALSGMHVSLLLSVIQGLLGLFFYEKTSKIISFIIVGMYIFSIPPSYSLQRAYLCVVLQFILNRYFNKIDILSFLIIISLIYNPYILYSTSFVFSYFIYFIVLVTSNIKYSSIWIYIGTLPIVLNINYELPLFSLIYLFFISPFVEFFYIIILLTLFIKPVEFIGIFIVFIFNNLIDVLYLINIKIIFSKPDFSFIIIYYFLYFLCLYRTEKHLNINKYISVMISLMISFYFTSHYKIYAQVSMIDVGQGDCTLIRLPMNKGNILIDTGGNKDYDLAVNTIIPYLKSIGITHLDYVYISHEDYDHSGALTSLTEEFDVKNVIKNYEEIRYIDQLKVEMLKTDKKYIDKNDNSLIMYLSYKGTSFLFTGDISKEVEKDLYNKYKKLNVDILKVSHHGSLTSTSSYLLSLIKPSIAMIGVKDNNIYKHPSEIVLNRLAKRNITILRTDKDGMFHICFYGKDYYIFR